VFGCPAGWQFLRALNGIVDDGGVANRGSNDLVTATLKRNQQLPERAGVHHDLRP